MTDKLYAMFMLLKEYKEDSRYSKPCYINQMDKLLHQLTEDLMNPITVDLDQSRISIFPAKLSAPMDGCKNIMEDMHNDAVAANKPKGTI